jgi:hypothetical protein
MNRSGSNLFFSATVKAVPAHTVGTRQEDLQHDPGLRFLLHAKDHLWMDLLNLGTENEEAIEFLSEFVLLYRQADGLGRA